MGDKMKLEQINNTKNKIKKIFDDIRDTLNDKQCALLKELEKIQYTKSNQITNDDEKEEDVYAFSIRKLQKEKENLSFALESCKNLIKLSKNNDAETKQKRKEKMMKIGNNANEKFDATQIELNQNKNLIEQMIEKNSKNNIEIDFVVNDGIYQKILDKIKSIGTLKNEYFDANNQREEKVNIMQDPEDKIIADLTEKHIDFV